MPWAPCAPWPGWPGRPLISDTAEAAGKDPARASPGELRRGRAVAAPAVLRHHRRHAAVGLPAARRLAGRGADRRGGRAAAHAGGRPPLDGGLRGRRRRRLLEYFDASGHGLSNQGWKDSADAVRFADGRIADGPVALCEVQAYAYEAATHGADLLEAFGRAGRRGLPALGRGPGRAVPDVVLVRRRPGPLPRPGPGPGQAAGRLADQQHRPPAGHRPARRGRGSGGGPAAGRSGAGLRARAAHHVRRRRRVTTRSATTAVRSGRTTPPSRSWDCTARGWAGTPMAWSRGCCALRWHSSSGCPSCGRAREGRCPIRPPAGPRRGRRRRPSSWRAFGLVAERLIRSGTLILA